MDFNPLARRFGAKRDKREAKYDRLSDQISKTWGFYLGGIIVVAFLVKKDGSTIGVLISIPVFLCFVVSLCDML